MRERTSRFNVTPDGAPAATKSSNYDAWIRSIYLRQGFRLKQRCIEKIPSQVCSKEQSCSVFSSHGADKMCSITTKSIKDPRIHSLRSSITHMRWTASSKPHKQLGLTTLEKLSKKFDILDNVLHAAGRLHAVPRHSFQLLIFITIGILSPPQ